MRVVCTMHPAIWMVVFISWISLVGASMGISTEESDNHYPSCYFNPLCTCSKAVPDLGVVICRNVPFSRLPLNLNTSKVFILHLENNGLRYLQPYFLHSTSLYKLEISHNPMVDFPDSAFLGLEVSLWELKLRHNLISTIPSRSFRHFQKLLKLNLEGNQIWDIPTDAWRGLDGSLEELNLASNSLTVLPSNAFSSLKKLKSLDLSNNNLLDLEYATFQSGPPLLSCLLLNDNQLVRVPYGALSGLGSLRILDLSRNRIIRLRADDDVDGRLPKLTLDELRLGYNHIERLSATAFRRFRASNLTILDGNPIQSVPDGIFKGCIIRDISFKDCGISQRFSYEAFAGLENHLHSVDLSGNNVTLLMPWIMDKFPNLKNLVLDDAITPVKFTAMAFTEPHTHMLLGLNMVGAPPVNIHQLSGLKHLRWLSLGKLSISTHLGPEDLAGFGSDLEELRITSSNLDTIKNNAFHYAKTLRVLDLSENGIHGYEPRAFTEIGHSLTVLKLSHALTETVTAVPSEVLSPLIKLEHLDLSNNYFKSVKESTFLSMNNLQVLELNDNEITEIEKGTFRETSHPCLKHISFAYNDLTVIENGTFVDLSALQRIWLNDNKIVTIESHAFVSLLTLRELTLRGNQLETLSSEALQNLPRLEELDLAYNELLEFDFTWLDQVGTLSSIRLNVSHNLINGLDVGISRVTPLNAQPTSITHNIKVLDLSHNNISYVARGFFRPVTTSLTHLYMEYNSIGNLTKQFLGTLTHLQWLDLSHNRIGEIDFDTFNNVKQLQVLYLNDNDLGELPMDLFDSSNSGNLRILDLSNNRLRIIPDGMFQYTYLERLSLSNNRLSRIPINSLRPDTLCDLDLSGNEITSLHEPDIFKKFKILSFLDLSSNNILRIDEITLSSMADLRVLRLNNNKNLIIESGERKYYQGTQNLLRTFEIRNCTLSSIPELILPNLLHLDVAENAISTIPHDLTSNFSSIRHLDLRDNSIENLFFKPTLASQLRSLLIAGNPIGKLSNSTFIGFRFLEELDISRLPLNTFEAGSLSHLKTLKRLHISTYPFEKKENFKIFPLLVANPGIVELHIHEDLSSGGAHRLGNGSLPDKLRNMTITGHAFHSLPDDLLEGIFGPNMHFGLHNTSVEVVSPGLFMSAARVRNWTLDVTDSRLSTLNNPSSAQVPGQSKHSFLQSLRIGKSNPWHCDCLIGWMEVWERKQRQFECQWDRQDNFEPIYSICMGSDDLREASCFNRNNKTLSDVLKTEIECGWGGTQGIHTVSLLGPLIGALFLTVFPNLIQAFLF